MHDRQFGSDLDLARFEAATLAGVRGFFRLAPTASASVTRHERPS